MHTDVIIVVIGIHAGNMMMYVTSSLTCEDLDKIEIVLLVIELW